MTSAPLLQAGRSDFHVHSSVSLDTARDCTPENLATVAAGLGLRCLYVLAELGFGDADFVDLAGLRRLREESR